LALTLAYTSAVPEWTPTIWLIAQAALTIIMIEQLRRHVFPALGRLSSPQIVLDVWAPLTLILPLLMLAGRAGHDMRGAGWLVVAAPSWCAWLALGMVMIVQRRDQGRIDCSATLAWSCTGAGVLLVMLSAAHDLTLWVAQCAFALGAVLMWMNTPQDLSDRVASTEPQRAGLAMLIALLCAAGAGAAAQMSSVRALPVIGAIQFAGVASALAAAARVAGPAAAFRLGGWSAVYGTFLGLGAISLVRLAPEALHVIQHGQSNPIKRVAYGFGHFGLEGMLLAILIAACLMGVRLNEIMRRVFGVVVLAGAAFMIAWRLTTL
jgi:hypothetical protein